MVNALRDETSPYLLQHADNPVDWLPWGPAALGRAAELNKPILLSIGYSACHWCHVMAHESFEDEATAARMNELFVSIKVDREERPDLDRIYQLSQQMFTGRPGGWPLTVFLTPGEQLPFFAGTYFPKQAAYGMPSFGDVLQRVADYFRTHRDQIHANGARLLEALDATIVRADNELAIDRRYREAARRRLGEAFDAANGGFGQAPKFPHASEIGFLLGLAPGDEGAERMAVTALTAMARGGLFDHLGGGFFRYCVDADWRIPHFEKMLYDNAALLGVLADAHALTGEALFAAAAKATADWLHGTMRDAGGAFYATLDADSEGEEGRYYSFTPEDFAAALDADERAAASAYFGLGEAPNFEGRRWHLQPRERVLPFGAAGPAIESARGKLLALRDTRVAPGRDDKILTAWNGLLAGNLARAARRLDRPELGDTAGRILDFIRAQLWQDGRLFASFQDGRARFPGYLDDYALTAAGLIERMQWRFRAEDLAFAVALADCLLEHFADTAGGFFFTADDHEPLIHRPKPLADESLPSGNGTAALVLDTLGHLLGEPRYLDAAAATVRSSLPGIARYPEGHASLLEAIDRTLEPPELVVVRAKAAELEPWRRHLDTDFAVGRLQFLIPDDAGTLPGLLGTRESGDGPAAYVCRGTVCAAPVHDLEALDRALGRTEGA
jgi:hypothetical protein